MTEEQERAKEWIRSLHPEVRDALIKKCIEEKERKRRNESK